MTKLDNYESALLTELRTQVAERSAAVATRNTRRRYAYGGLVAAAVAGIATAASFALPGGGAAPAFAVNASDGWVTVTVHDLQDSDALESALADHGVNADISYLTADKMCAPRAYRSTGAVISVGTDSNDSVAAAEAMEKQMEANVTGLPDSYDRVPMGSHLENGALSFTFPADLTADGSTFILDMTVGDEGPVPQATNLAEGPVPACDPIDVPAGWIDSLLPE